MFLRKGATIVSLLLGLSSVFAEQKPCLILSGSGGTDYAVDLMKFNRIAFGEESMTLSNSSSSDAPLEILYSAYNRFKVGDAEPTVESAIDEIAGESPIQLTYSRSDRSLTLTADGCDETFSVGVFNMNGTLILHGELRPGESLAVESLGSGAYVAVAVGKDFSQSLKFVK